jgi:hypothetical protein
VVATGLNLLLFGGVYITVNGIEINRTNMTVMKGMIFHKIPNFFLVFGYFNASWSLRLELIAMFINNVLAYMKKNNYRIFEAVIEEKYGKYELKPFFEGFSSGYLNRAFNEGMQGPGYKDILIPHCASRHPWKSNRWLLSDFLMFFFSPIHEKELHFYK